MRINVILAAIVSVLTGVLVGSSITAVQQSGIPAAGLAAALLGMVSLITTACPLAIGAAWVVDRCQSGPRRAGCQ